MILLTTVEQIDEVVGDPVAVANAGFVYTKDVGGVTQLFYEDSAGVVTQLTPLAAVQSVWPKDAADALGTVVTAQRAFDRNHGTGVWTFLAGSFVPNAAVAASAGGNSATLTIEVRTALGALVGTLGTITTALAWVANVPKAVVAGAVSVVNPGEYLTITITKTGAAGRIIPAGALVLAFKVS